MELKNKNKHENESETKNDIGSAAREGTVGQGHVCALARAVSWNGREGSFAHTRVKFTFISDVFFTVIFNSI